MNVEMQVLTEQSSKQHQTPNAWNTPTRVLTDLDRWPKLAIVSPLVANEMIMSNKLGSPSADQRREVIGTKQRKSVENVRACSNEDFLWSQNMQDLGICEELACINDFNIPDVDLTFQNFEEFFGCDQDLTRALFDDKDMTCDASVASSVYIIQSANLDKDIGLFSCEGCSYQIRPSYSSLPPSLTKFGAESNATDYMEGCFSPVIAREESPCNSPELKGSESNTEGNAMLRHKDKKVRR
ncbi:hypothetical protein TEA_020431 [Camellia sinensis var. sinensis]|uniref:Uncharacterized protein n=1 Tax=Camellia sinensis var. sinensis TaxID=542762 RepID=A0A4S4CVU5_CAMSN|nr:hypothetical protein TEA_020431 [Camellia sinensis var. sinensis]